MADTESGPPEKPVGAEIVVKQSFGVSIGLFGDDEVDIHPAIAVFANREGFQFLADYFTWLAKRELPKSAQSSCDPGCHVHLTPHSENCDEVNFTFTTLTATNRDQVLIDAGATNRSRRCGSPIRQFRQLCGEIVEDENGLLNRYPDLREAILAEIDELATFLRDVLRG